MCRHIRLDLPPRKKVRMLVLSRVCSGSDDPVVHLTRYNQSIAYLSARRCKLRTGRIHQTRVSSLCSHRFCILPQRRILGRKAATLPPTDNFALFLTGPFQTRSILRAQAGIEPDACAPVYLFGQAQLALSRCSGHPAIWPMDIFLQPEPKFLRSINVNLHPA